MNLNNIEAVVYDFDGVFTNNQVIVSEDGLESVICSRSDGLGLEMLRSINIPMKIISSEINNVVVMRAKKLNLPVVHGVKNKLKELKLFSVKTNIELKNIAFVGNDINDKECMEKVGYPIAVGDSVLEIRKIAKVQLIKNGGHGAVREFCELLYKAYKK